MTVAKIGALLILLVIIPLPVSADQVVYAEDFESGSLDGWYTLGAIDEGYDYWIQSGELWGRASSGGDCSYHPTAHGYAVIDSLIVSDVVLDITLTNRNACGWFGVLLRVTEESWAHESDVGYWRLFLDPGAQVMAVQYWDYGDTSCGSGAISYSFGTNVPHYFRIVLVGSTIQLLEKPSPSADYDLVYTTTCPNGSLEGRVAVVVGQAAKHASFDDIIITAIGVSPVQEATWGAVKALYR